MNIRVYNYNTLQKLKTFEAHTDYIRCIVVHPTQPYILTSSDDMSIKLWDWDKNWANIQVFEGHGHYVMMLSINPKDHNTFASASLDRTIKIWGIGSSTAHFTLEGHDKGVNCVDYYVGGEKPYLISGGDDKLVKVWDYQNKTCVASMEGHSHNVSVVCCHPVLPLIMSGSEDGTLRIWHSNTFKLEKTLNYGMERVWALGYRKNTNLVAAGYDEGTILIKLGKDSPIVSMDSAGKVIWSKNNEIQTINLKAVVEAAVSSTLSESGDNDNNNNNNAEAARASSLVLPFNDGEKIPNASSSIKDLGHCEIFPQSLQHNPNGRFVVVSGDGEYIIYTALAWRNKSFGNGLDVVWGSDPSLYAVRETTSRVKIFKNFKEHKTFQLNFSSESLFGGKLLGVRGRDFVSFYDWEDARLIRKIEVNATKLYWSEAGTLLTLSTKDSMFVLHYHEDHVTKNDDSMEAEDPDLRRQIAETGYEEAFEMVYEYPNERVRSAFWIGDCFVFTNFAQKLCYLVGQRLVVLSHLDRPLYALGYLASANRIFCIDKHLELCSYTLNLGVVNYQTAVLRGELELAQKILPNIPDEYRNTVAQFLDSQGLKSQAMDVTLDQDHKFELALQLSRLDVAMQIAKSVPADSRWKQLADIALAEGRWQMAEECLEISQDVNGLLLYYLASGNAAKMSTKLVSLATEQGKFNVAFLALLLTNQTQRALEMLVETDRIPEAALLARTYLPSQLTQLVQVWKQNLIHINPRAAEALAEPSEYPNLFPDIEWALKAEQYFVANTAKLPCTDFAKAREVLLAADLIQEAKNHGDKPAPVVAPVNTPTPTTSNNNSNAATTTTPVVPAISIPAAVPASPVVAPASPRVAPSSPTVRAPSTPTTPSRLPPKLQTLDDEVDDDELAKAIEEQIQADEKHK